MAEKSAGPTKRWRLLSKSGRRIKQYSAAVGDPAHQAVTLRGSPAVTGKQDQPHDSEFTKVTKVTHISMDGNSWRNSKGMC